MTVTGTGGKGDVKTAADTVRIGVLGPLEVTDAQGCARC